jgi:hypothetical protein
MTPFEETVIVIAALVVFHILCQYIPDFAHDHDDEVSE